MTGFKRKHKDFLEKILLVLSGVITALILLESCCRVYYKKPWYDRLLEKPRMDRSGVKPLKNSQGLRDRDYPAEKPANCRRVLFLGDSFTYGTGVADNSEVFPEILEAALNREYSKNGGSVEILNGGIPGSLTGKWVEVFHEVKKSFSPDLVVIVFFLRDGTVTSSMGGFFYPVRDEIRSRDRNSFLYQHSFLFRVIREQLDRRRLSEKYSRALMQSYFGSREQTREWENARNNLLKIKAQCESAGVKTALVVFPVLVELNSSYPFKRICEEIRNFGVSSGIPTHDLLPAFMGRYGPSLWVSSIDQHPNAKGHRIAAESLLPFIRSLLATGTALQN